MPWYCNSWLQLKHSKLPPLNCYTVTENHVFRRFPSLRRVQIRTTGLSCTKLCCCSHFNAGYQVKYTTVLLKYIRRMEWVLFSCTIPRRRYAQQDPLAYTLGDISVRIDIFGCLKFGIINFQWFDG